MFDKNSFDCEVASTILFLFHSLEWFERRVGFESLEILLHHTQYGRDISSPQVLWV